MKRHDRTPSQAGMAGCARTEQSLGARALGRHERLEIRHGPSFEVKNSPEGFKDVDVTVAMDRFLLTHAAHSCL